MSRAPISDCRDALARNYEVCQALVQRVNRSVYPYDEPTISDYDRVAESMGLTVNMLAEDGGRGHSIYGLFYGGAFTQSLHHGGVLLGIIDEDNSGPAYVVCVYPTDNYSTALTGKFAEPLPIKITTPVDDPIVQACIDNGGHFWPEDAPENEPATCTRCWFNPGWKAGKPRNESNVHPVQDAPQA